MKKFISTSFLTLTAMASTAGHGSSSNEGIEVNNTPRTVAAVSAGTIRSVSAPQTTEQVLLENLEKLLLLIEKTPRYVGSSEPVVHDGIAHYWDVKDKVLRFSSYLAEEKNGIHSMELDFESVLARKMKCEQLTEFMQHAQSTLKPTVGKNPLDAFISILAPWH